MAKEKKASTLVKGFEMSNKEIIQGPRLYEELFKEVQRKFNPSGRKDKII